MARMDSGSLSQPEIQATNIALAEETFRIRNMMKASLRAAMLRILFAIGSEVCWQHLSDDRSQASRRLARSALGRGPMRICQIKT